MDQFSVDCEGESWWTRKSAVHFPSACSRWGLMTVPCDRTHLIQKEPQTFTQAVCHSVACQLGPQDPCQKLNVHPGRARYTHRSPQFNWHTPTSSVSYKHFRAVLQMLPNTYLISLFVLRIHTVFFTHAHNSQKLLHLQSGWQVYPAFAESCVWQI